MKTIHSHRVQSKQELWGLDSNGSGVLPTGHSYKARSTHGILCSFLAKREVIASIQNYIELTRFIVSIKDANILMRLSLNEGERCRR